MTHQKDAKSHSRQLSQTARNSVFPSWAKKANLPLGTENHGLKACRGVRTPLQWAPRSSLLHQCAYKKIVTTHLGLECAGYFEVDLGAGDWRSAARWCQTSRSPEVAMVFLLWMYIPWVAGRFNHSYCYYCHYYQIMLTLWKLLLKIFSLLLLSLHYHWDYHYNYFHDFYYSCCCCSCYY